MPVAASSSRNQKLRAAGRANAYWQDARIRRNVWSRLLVQWPTEERVLVIAHSLGSVVLVDLLGRLPEGSTMDIITLGSPLAAPGFAPRARKLAKRFPFSRVRTWVNVRDPNDDIAWFGGLSHLIPGVIDVKVDTHGSHDVGKYLQRKPVAAMVANFLET